MFDFELDGSSLSRRIVRAVCDIAHRPLTGLRVLDLGCAHGHYCFEMAKRGAQVVGIEGRASWLEVARKTQADRGLTNVEFFHDDVRNLSKAKYGEFDIVLCLGLLYHLDAPDVFDFVAQLHDVCRDFTLIETHISPSPVISHTWRGHTYWGESTFEHAPDTSPEDKLKKPGASLDNLDAFWFTQASLCNILRHVGYTSVMDCRNPLAYLYVGPDWDFKLWGNRVTYAAIKGQPVDLHVGPAAHLPLDRDWPESTDGLRFEDYIIELDHIKAGAAYTPPTTLSPREIAALRADVERLRAENARQQALIRGYEQGRLMRLMRWLHKLGIPGV